MNIYITHFMPTYGIEKKTLFLLESISSKQMFLLPQFFSPSQCTIFHDAESWTKINHLKYDKYKEYAKMKSCSKIRHLQFTKT